MTTTTTGLRPAARMSTIGTESAFEVSARARALEATGRSIIHLQIGEPDFDTSVHVREAAKRALDEGQTHYAPFPGIPALREAIAADVQLRKGVTADPEAGLRHRRRQGRDAVRDPRPGRPGRRGHRAGPRLPDLRVADPLRGRDRRADPDPHGARLPARRRRARVADHAANPGPVHQLAREPDRRRAHPRRPDPHRRTRRGARPVGHLRRDLRPCAVRRPGARLDRDPPRDGGADDHPRRLLQDLRDDRLAPRLCGRPGVAHPDLRPARHQHDLVRADVRPGRRGGRPDRAAGRRGRDGRRVQGPARPHRRRA